MLAPFKIKFLYKITKTFKWMPCCNKWPIQNGMYSVVWDFTICWLMAFTQLALKCNILSPNIQYIISYHILTYIWIICTYTYNWHYVYSVIVVVVHSFLKDTNNCECKIFHGNICDIKTYVQNIASVGYSYMYIQCIYEYANCM